VLTDREGDVHAVIRPEDLLLSRFPLDASARNRLRGTVMGIERTGAATLVTVDVGRPLAAALTAAAADELGLRTGDTVSLTLKAVAVHIV